MTDRPLPALPTATLDAALLEAFLRDLTEHTEVLDVLEKRAPGAHADLRPVELRSAVARLCAGQVRAVQVRYRWNGEEWRDTLLPTDAGLRLVRARMQELM